MWISNTATAVMMLPIGMAIITQLEDDPNTTVNETTLFGKVLMLSIAYSASIGGIATLVGTPPNLVFAGIVEQIYGLKISFFQWAMVGVPISLLLLFLCWLYLTGYAFTFEKQEFPGGREEINRLRKNLGKTGKQEKRVLAVFGLTAFFWITRSFLLEPFMPLIDDTIIAMIAAISLFIIPAGNGKGSLITWEEAVKVPWGIILLFGGGMALAKAFGNSGLAVWIGQQLVSLDALPLLFLLLVLVTAVNFLTEVTSNLATTAMLLPILATMALALHVHPYLLMVGATLAASCAFMLPVATPPNAVVFGSGHLRIPDMIRSGLIMNLISIVIVTLFVYFLLPLLWEIDPNDIPQLIQRTK
jgi:solute carrier family 13 (sodium-dependent dicarboxylate transporter), member 2/3/5